VWRAYSDSADLLLAGFIGGIEVKERAAVNAVGEQSWGNYGRRQRKEEEKEGCRYPPRSAASHQLTVPPHRRVTYGGRAFAVAGPSTWNSLPKRLHV